MSYPQQTAPLPFPAHQLIAPLIQLDYRNPPARPNVSYLPTGLAPFYAQIVCASIDAVQAKAGANALRAFMFNQLSVNQFNNQDFAVFLEGIIRLLDMRLTTGVYRDIPSGIIDAATVYAELQAAVNATKYPGLVAALDPQMINGVNKVIGIYHTLANEMNQHSLAIQQGRVYPYGAAPVQAQGYPQQFIQQPAQGQVAYVQPAQPNWVQPVQPSWVTPTQGVSAIIPSNSASIFTTGGQAAAVRSTDGQYSSRFSSPYDGPDAPKARVDPVSPALNVQDMRRTKEQQMTPQPPVEATLPPNVVLASQGTVKWNPSPQASINVAYNPNESDLCYEIKPDGTTLPKTRKKAKMDIVQHLVVPSFVPTPPLGVASLNPATRNFEMDEALAADAAAIEKLKPVELNAAYKDEGFTSALSLEELWFDNDLSLAAMRKKAGKVNLHRSCTLVLDPLVSEKDPKPFLDLLKASSTFAEAHAILMAAQSQVLGGTHPNLDVRSLTFINNRLTHRVNEFLKKELAVENGWISSFLEDIVSLLPYIERRYGESARKAMTLKQAELVRRAVLYGEKAFEDDQNEALLPDQETPEGKAAAELNITYFTTYVTLTSVDLFSVELKMEIPLKDVAVGVFEHETPLPRQLAENIFMHEKVLQLSFDRHLLRTADGVLLEFTKSAMHSEFFLVAAI